MNALKLIGGLVLLAALVVVIQLGDNSDNSPVAAYRALPATDFVAMAQAEARDAHPDRALLLLDYAIENRAADHEVATVLRGEYHAQLTGRATVAGRLHAVGWSAAPAGDNAYASLAVGTVADATLHGAIASLGEQGALENPADGFINALNACKPMAAVFPPASQAITLTKAARASGSINNVLAGQLTVILDTIRAAPQSAAAVENFRANIMPLVELSRQCRTWSEFHILLLQADSADQVKVLTRMASSGPGAARKAAQVLTIATRQGGPGTSPCLDYILRHGPAALDALHAGMTRGGAGLAFVIAHPPLPAAAYAGTETASTPLLEPIQASYRELHARYGAGVTLFKYWLIAVLAALMVLTFVPGVYLEKLMITPGKYRARPEPGAVHHLMVALGVGVAVSVLTYVFSMAMSPASDAMNVAAQNATATGAGAAGPGMATKQDSALLSGMVVALSLLAHTVIWFWVRSKLRQVEEDEGTEAALRLQRLDNLDMFLDLPLFTGLALTVIAFVLITFDAGMSRHFAYTSTVVGILSAVSLRVWFLYPLKERLIHNRWSARS